jgi:hypothetical protein
LLFRRIVILLWRRSFASQNAGATGLNRHTSVEFQKRHGPPGDFDCRISDSFKNGLEIIFFRNVAMATCRFADIGSSSAACGKTRYVAANNTLAAKPSGRVAWLDCDPHPQELCPFRWFGGGFQEPACRRPVGPRAPLNQAAVRSSP